MIARAGLVLGKIVHDKIRVDAGGDDLVSRVRCAHRERPRTRPVSCEQPRGCVFHHKTCGVESVCSARMSSAPHHTLNFSRLTRGRTILRVYTEARRAGEVWIWLWLATLYVVGGYVARCRHRYTGAGKCLGGIDVRR